MRKDGEPLRKQAVVAEKARGVNFRSVVTVLGLDSVGGEEDGRLGRAVDLVAQDGVLHLQVEQPLYKSKQSIDNLINELTEGYRTVPECEATRILNLNAFEYTFLFLLSINKLLCKKAKLSLMCDLCSCEIFENMV
jgi:hypothetical protein